MSKASFLPSWKDNRIYIQSSRKREWGKRKRSGQFFPEERKEEAIGKRFRGGNSII